MEAKEIDLIEIRKLKDGGCYMIPESDYGKAEVWKINDFFFVFLIPMYGGNPTYFANYHEKKALEMIAEIYSLT